MASSIPPTNREPPGENNSRGSSMTFALRSLMHGYADLQRHIAHQLGLGINDVVALEHLVRRSDLGPADVASLLGITTASATVLVDRLEVAGHVERRTHPGDRRRKQLLVTRHAQEEMLRALQPVFDIHQDIDREYNSDEQAVIESYLSRVSRRYQEHVQGGPVDRVPPASRTPLESVPPAS